MCLETPLLMRCIQHFFDDIGYRHEPYQHCPQGAAHAKGKCWCDPKQNFGGSLFFCACSVVLVLKVGDADNDYYSCKRKFDRIFK